jgi:hypothetical protein
MVGHPVRCCGLYYSYGVQDSFPPSSGATLLTTLVAVAFISDRLKVRGIIMLCTMPIAIVGYAVIANIPNHPKVKYGMTVLVCDYP